MPDTDSEIKEFAERVKWMREAQDEFHKRGLWTLKEKAILLEADVDRVCERILSCQKVFMYFP